MSGQWPVLDNDALIKLRRPWPGWEFWTVAIWPTGTVRWCARLRADHQIILEDDSPAHLNQTIADHVIDRRNA